MIKPITTEILFQGQIKTLTFHIPTNEEDVSILRRLKEYPEDERVLMEGIIRMAVALIAVDDKQIKDIFPTIEQRIAWIKDDWPDALFDKVCDAYYLALEKPYQKLREMITDPSIVAALFGNGEESAATSDPDKS